MTQMPANPFQSLVIVAWRRADFLVHEIARALGLGLTPCRPFLLRPVRARLAADLARFEALVRRLLVLMVLEQALPAFTPRAPAMGAPAGKGRPPAPRRYLAVPAFRLADPAPRTVSTPPPRRPAGGLRPRILRLDQPLPPPDPWEYAPRADQLVPSQPLVRRLAALCAVFDDPAHHLTRMARFLARTRATPSAPRYRLAPLPPAARARRVPQDEREAMRQVHTEACAQLARFDTS
ncbi:hypothetical protein [Hyphomonas johnsonii]|uniref:Uncharacterized protein n=1 Tax=Hyphomonas johnsonii MHS-2 TaxID=1280950 RepID=A0A059FPK8_9PROT|nr:hypothetical protein [Hyphomonas johnsonii]KCZ92461.1 hypothetical protein HJO_10509 [Hyphomonas johnsonii MHS-2]